MEREKLGDNSDLKMQPKMSPISVETTSIAPRQSMIKTHQEQSKWIKFPIMIQKSNFQRNEPQT